MMKQIIPPTPFDGIPQPVIEVCGKRIDCRRVIRNARPRQLASGYG